MFKELTTLPPCCTEDYKIHLWLTTKLAHVKPYMYAYYQKIEIKKLVKELLQNGIIQPITSAFSSPLIIVKKWLVVFLYIL